MAEDRGKSESAEPGSAAGAPEVQQPRGRASRPPRLTGVRWREVPVTSALLVANILVAAAVLAVSGETADMGALVDFGANVKSATAAGDWWRLVSSNFLHVGLLHLALNMYGLWVLGRLVEQFLGRRRMLVLYVAAGVCGAAASLLFGGPATSAGASGAIFGLLGAAVAELGLHRRFYPRRWSSALLGNLVFLAAANVAIGFLYPMIDQSAHMGGLATGAVLGALLSRKLRFADSRWMRGLVAALAVISGGSLAYGAWGAATSDFAATLASYPRVTRQLAGLQLEVPEHWQPGSQNEIGDPSLGMILVLQGVPAVGDRTLESAIDGQREHERTEGARQQGLNNARQAADTQLPLPPPWLSKELVADQGEGVTGDQRYRIAVIGRDLGGRRWIGLIYYPASLGDDLTPTVRAVLGSARPAPAR